METILTAVHEAIGDARFIAGSNGTLISLCPHTEPFKSNDSTNAIVEVVANILPLGNRIQISTKETVPDAFLMSIQSAEHYKGQVTVFVSVTSISDCDVYEPYAPCANVRLSNIVKLREYGILNCLYIKPFLFLKENVPALINTIEEIKPDALCVGIYYQEGSAEAFHHPTDKTISSKGVSQGMADFLGKYNLVIPVFTTSSCVVAYLNHSINNISIPKELCIGCQCNCGGNGKWQS